MEIMCKLDALRKHSTHWTKQLKERQCFALWIPPWPVGRMHLDWLLEKQGWPTLPQQLSASSTAAHGPAALALPGTWPSSPPPHSPLQLSGRTYGFFSCTHVQETVKKIYGQKEHVGMCSWNPDCIHHKNLMRRNGTP